MRITHPHHAALLAASALLLTGCGEPTPVVDTLSNSSWGAMKDGQQVFNEPILTFQDDGTVFGSDGCAFLKGQWGYTLSDRTPVFRGLVTTDPDRICAHREVWFQSAGSMLDEGDTLVIFGTDGERLGEIPRRAMP